MGEVSIKELINFNKPLLIVKLLKYQFNMKMKSSLTNPLTLFNIKVKFCDLFLVLFIVVNFTTFSQITAINEILKDLETKQQQLPKHYSELVAIYQNKQSEITGKIEALETNHKLEIYKKEVNINELKTEYVKYKKQGSLYNSIKTFCDDHKNYEMQLYENKADCKSIKKRFTAGFKKVKLLFAVFATAQPGMDREIHNRDLLYFWSDSSITIESNFKSYLPDYLLSNKIQSRPFLNHSDHIILEYYNTDMLMKLISYINYKKPLEINNKVIDLTNEINASNLKFNEEKLSLSSTKETFSIDTLIKNRAVDSLTLLTLENYYVNYPKELANYNKLLSIEKVKDKALMETYNSALVNFEKNAKYKRSKIEAEADKCFSWIKTEFNDPYSAIFEEYGLVTYPYITEKYPCAKIYWLDVRAKNVFGSYVPGEYLVVMIDGNPITASKHYSNSINEGNLSMSLLLMLKEGCKNSNFTEPTKPMSAEERIPKPIMKEYDFKFSLN